MSGEPHHGTGLPFGHFADSCVAARSSSLTITPNPRTKSSRLSRSRNAASSPLCRCSIRSRQRTGGRPAHRLLRSRQRPPQRRQCPLQVSQRLLIVPAPEEALSHPMRQNGAPQRRLLPAPSETLSIVRFLRPPVIAQHLGVRCQACRLVARAEQVCLGPAPVLGPYVMVRHLGVDSRGLAAQRHQGLGHLSVQPPAAGLGQPIARDLSQ